MNIQEFRAVSEHLVAHHMYITFDDFPMTEDADLAEFIAQGVSPIDIINDFAGECDLARRDMHGPYGTEIWRDLTVDDLRAAIHSLGLTPS